MPEARIELSRRAQRDLRGLRGSPDLGRALDGLDRLAEGAENVDIKALQGAAPWIRLRVGDVRVIYRPLTTEELQSLPGSSVNPLVLPAAVALRNARLFQAQGHARHPPRRRRPGDAQAAHHRAQPADVRGGAVFAATRPRR